MNDMPNLESIAADFGSLEPELIYRSPYKSHAFIKTLHCQNLVSLCFKKDSAISEELRMGPAWEQQKGLQGECRATNLTSY
jgi:hypothetical protein